VAPAHEIGITFAGYGSMVSVQTSIFSSFVRVVCVRSCFKLTVIFS
jgi:hypothetical protein